MRLAERRSEAGSAGIPAHEKVNREREVGGLQTKEGGTSRFMRVDGIQNVFILHYFSKNKLPKNESDSCGVE